MKCHSIHKYNDFTGIAAYILAGGQSKRMGENKSFIKIEGIPIIERIVNVLKLVINDISIITRTPLIYDYLQLPSYSDLRIDKNGLGPLSGIETALFYCKKPFALIVACDLPFISEDFLKLLAKGKDLQKITMAEDITGQPQYLCGIYPRSLLQTVTNILDEGTRSVWKLLNTVQVEPIGFLQYQHLHNAEKILANINTPKDIDVYS